MATFGWFFIGILVYIISWILGYRVGYKDGNHDTMAKLRKTGYL